MRIYLFEYKFLFVSSFFFGKVHRNAGWLFFYFCSATILSSISFCQAHLFSYLRGGVFWDQNRIILTEKTVYLTHNCFTIFTAATKSHHKNQMKTHFPLQKTLEHFFFSDEIILHSLNVFHFRLLFFSDFCTFFLCRMNYSNGNRCWWNYLDNIEKKNYAFHIR